MSPKTASKDMNIFVAHKVINDQPVNKLSCFETNYSGVFASSVVPSQKISIKLSLRTKEPIEYMFIVVLLNCIRYVFDQ